MKLIDKYSKSIEKYKFDLYWVTDELISPYKLSFTEINHYDTLFLVLKSDDKIGIGEITTLPGYSNERIEDVWKLTKWCIDEWVDPQFIESDMLLEEIDGFSISAINTCLESYRQGLNKSNLILESNVIYTFNSIQDLMKDLKPNNINIIKVKIGSNVEYDYQKNSQIIDLCIKSRALDTYLRLDANQGYKIEEARVLLKNLSLCHTKIEYYEQLLHKNDKLNLFYLLDEFHYIKYLLDESVFTLQDYIDLKELYSRNIPRVKTKLFKLGSMKELYNFIMSDKIPNEVVLGNGVQSYIGTLYEVLCQKLCPKFKVNTFGEFNGVNKIKDRLKGIEFVDNKIRIDVKEIYKNVLNKLEEL